MPPIKKEIIEQIEDAADIVEVVRDILGDYCEGNPGGLRKKGVNYTAICPFHDDHNDGNFMVRPKNVSSGANTYKCFACGEKGGPVQFLMKHEHLSFPDAIRWLGKKYNIEVDNVPFDYVPPPRKPLPPPLPTLVLPRQMVRNRTGNTEHDNLCSWIRSLPWSPEQQARVEPVLKDYLMGHSTICQEDRMHNTVKHEFTVFWQVDHEGNPRTAHYMKYKPSGKRMHKEDDRYNTDWLHSLLDRNGYTHIFNATKQCARQCLFGEHLLNRYPAVPINLVESEKTAIIMAIAYGNHQMSLWLACSGLSNFTREKLAPIIQQRRKVVLFPDRDGIDKWKQAAEQLHYDRLVFNTSLVTKWWKPEDGPKADCADVIVRLIRESAAAKNGGAAITPEMKQVINKLNLEPI